MKKATLPNTAVRFFTLLSNLYKLTSFLTSSAIKQTSFDDVDTTNALNSREFYPVLGKIALMR